MRVILIFSSNSQQKASKQISQNVKPYLLFYRVTWGVTCVLHPLSFNPLASTSVPPSTRSKQQIVYSCRGHLWHWVVGFDWKGFSNVNVVQLHYILCGLQGTFVSSAPLLISFSLNFSLKFKIVVTFFFHHSLAVVSDTINRQMFAFKIS